ncbi:MAG: lipoprotein [Alphaproteobacteria bacterium]|nr:lipoprotein [Alphaproteobacteria bacterium]
MKKIIFIFSIAFILAACGRMSPPCAPDGSVYPVTYIIKE